MHEIDAVLIAARRDGFLTIDVSVEELARVAHQCRKSADAARRGNLKAARAKKARAKAVRTRFRERGR